MHPRNPYRTPPDFHVLAETYPKLKAFLHQTSTGVFIDFQDEAAQRCLTQALLYRDFGLSLDLPSDRLCPPVPNRLNYILWIQDILEACNRASPANETVQGVDIGTGASAIYPLLGCRANPTWRFSATEIDKQSIEFASRNTASNGLGDRIEVLQAQQNDRIFPAPVFQNAQVDFTMCNPPFYRSREELLNSTEAKELDPNAVCTGADTEMITTGGEVAFVRKMVQESKHLKERCRWYTSMLGKMSSIADIVQFLKAEKIDNYAITEFVQGKTRRWAIAWSFGDVHLPDSISRISNPVLQSIMPSRNTLRQPYPHFKATTEAEQVLLRVLKSVEEVTVTPTNPASEEELLVKASRNTWSRSARRQKLMAVESIEPQRSSPALVCCIRCLRGTNDARHSSGREPIVLEFVWVQGKDRGLFESFMSHVARKLDTLLRNPDVEIQ